MDSDDEQLLRGRVYGHDQPGPRPGQRYAELVGGPLDGLLLDITEWTGDDWTRVERDAGVALPTELGRFGAGGRAMYAPRPGDPRRFDWSGDMP
ncbi:hypothetical protein DMA15_04205 [Streptomyces sp. WAC 01529]|uniref:hypothetical protein n=1 Tax=Streptomyces sp. WAC 01529 TaxID=2203205 RepID=UPI000F6C952F|nr:hypothetical protein [Streptomyces sp. WAC 01529]AZM51889.1 hypothetical protein DMA15_04205 [Streptomyces sp. WAC 01529]